MDSAQYVIVYTAMLLTLLLVDGIWLGVVARTFYKRHLGHLLSARPAWGPALLFYPLYVAGLLLFVVHPSLDTDWWVRAAGLGAIFGCIAYATYDLTNAATLKQWPYKVTIIDIAWGGLISAVVSTVGYLVAQTF